MICFLFVCSIIDKINLTTLVVPPSHSFSQQSNLNNNLYNRFYNPLILTLSTTITLGGLVFSIAVPNGFHFLRNVALGSSSGGSQIIKMNTHFLSLAWLVCCAITASVIIYRDPSLLGFLRRGSGGYTSIEEEEKMDDDETLHPDTNTTPKPVYTTPTPANPESFNMFDPADLPPRLSEYANMVYSACEDLGNFFGFQDSSVRNQAEHLLILLSNNRRYMNSHILPVGMQPPSPIHALHAKVFSNYMKWCRYQGVRPHFSRTTGSGQAAMAAPPSVSSRVVDLVLFFCVWGEACNIRHMPECLWFLYHKMMEEYSVSVMIAEQAQLQNGMAIPPRSLYAGHYLDYVVTPIFKIVSAVSVPVNFFYVCTSSIFS